MFLDVWREKRIKRNPDEAIKSYSGATPTSCIKRIGLLIDTTVDVDVELLTEYIEGLRQHARLATICYVRHVNKMGFHANSTFDNTAFNWQGELNNAQVDFS